MNNTRRKEESHSKNESEGKTQRKMHHSVSQLETDTTRHQNNMRVKSYSKQGQN